MSLQFGKWNFDGTPTTPEYLAKVRRILSPYGPDGETSHSGGGVDLLYYAFHTTKDSRLEVQPHVSASDAILTWDGRLDNRADLIGLLGSDLSTGSTDVSIIAAAYERWGANCFGKLIGDWTLSIWNPRDRFLILAKDPIGTRHLYYSADERQLSWCSVLDPLVLFARRPFALEEEFIAGWLSAFPATHLTPYVGIHSVPPACFVRLAEGKRRTARFWDFDPQNTVRYRTDAEYEEHFRTVFREAVRRRLRSDSPILAELSGGMDSSSIVCMADVILSKGTSETPQLNTLSYYNDAEPNWNERPYFTKVEEKRGCAGCHIDIAEQESCWFASDDRHLLTPVSGRGRASLVKRQFASFISSKGTRVVLSGVGGDEVMGGVPTPVPEIMDSLSRLRLSALARQLKIWALNKRKPWLHLLLGAAGGFLPPGLVGVPRHLWPAPWLRPDFVRRNRAALTGYPFRVKLFGPLPAFQENMAALDGLRRHLACSPLSVDPMYEKHYPYLDRTLLEFIYAIPREQLVRPGQRRSLMRRALVGIVPEEVLNRKRKAFAVRGPIAAISTDWPRLAEMTEHMLANLLGIVEQQRFFEMLKKASEGQDVPTVALLRTLDIEFWLRSLKNHGISKPDPSSLAQSSAVGREFAEI